MSSKINSFLTFCNTIHTLRSPKGCPWDQKQTVKTLYKYIQEESNELLEAIQSDDHAHICEEAGDLLFLLVLLAEIENENKQFSMDDIITGINSKMIRRHPHVFANTPTGSEEELQKQWEKIKLEESAKKTN